MRAALAASLALLCGAACAAAVARAAPRARPRHCVPRPASPFAAPDLAALDAALTCGDACAYGEEGEIDASSGVPTVARSFSCPRLWLRLVAAGPAQEWPPPKEVPVEMVDAFTMGGKAGVQKWYIENRYSGGEALAGNWDATGLPARIAAATPETSVVGINSYDGRTPTYVDAVLAAHADAIAGGVGVVWGSERPWAEVLLARRGAAMTVTVEYGRVTSNHPAIRATTPQRFGAFMLQHDRRFDFAFTYSSLEHSGLGRYGDPLNPYGDLEAIAQTWCALKPGGLFFLGLPSADAGSTADVLVWNAHRFYGPHRLAQVFAGWEHVQSHRAGATPNESIIHVLRKPLA